MTKTVYLVTHVDEPAEDILTTILDPYDGYKGGMFKDLESAQKQLEEYLEQGLEYSIRTIKISVD